MAKYILVFLCFFLLSACSGGEAARGPGQRAAQVIVAEVKRDRFFDRIEALGTLKAYESVTLTASVAEIVSAVHFDDGQRVGEGDILVEMTSTAEHAQLEDARSRLKEAKRQYERIKPLGESGAAPVATIDERRREYETARAQIAVMQSRLADRLTIAPFSGVIGLRNVSVGTFVNPGEEIATLDDDSRMKLDFTVPTTFLSKLKAGMPVIAMARAFDNRRFEGTVSSIDSRIDPVTRSVVVRALIPNENRELRPGLLMSVELLKDERETLVIPEEAIIPEGDQTFVLVVAESAGKTIAERREISRGSRRPGEIEVLSGVEPGDLVIVHGSVNVRPGQEVIVLARESEGKSIRDLIAQEQNGEG